MRELEECRKVESEVGGLQNQCLAARAAHDQERRRSDELQRELQVAWDAARVSAQERDYEQLQVTRLNQQVKDAFDQAEEIQILSSQLQSSQLALQNLKHQHGNSEETHHSWQSRLQHSDEEVQRLTQV
jgi:hypothetical protein